MGTKVDNTVKLRMKIIDFLGTSFRDCFDRRFAIDRIANSASVESGISEKVWDFHTEFCGIIHVLNCS